MFVSSTGRCESILMSTIGELERSSTIPQRRKNARRDDDQPEQARRRPAPGFALGQRHHQREQAAGEQQRARDVDARWRADRRLGHVPVHERDREGDGDRAEQEEQPPREVVDDHAREDDAEAAADAEHGREQADPDLDLLGRELVADDREAEREECAAGAGDHAERDQRPDVPGEGRAEAPREEEPEADQQHPLLAELVAELAEDRRRHRGRRRGTRSAPRSSTPCSRRTPPGTSRAPGRPSSAAARTRCRRASGSRG